MKITLYLASFLGTGCGGGSPAGSPPKLDPAPALDCAALTDRLTACIDTFEAAYARTEDAGRRGAQAVGGIPNGVAGAATFARMYRDPAFRPAALEYCTQSWAERDPAWRRRLAACQTLAECGSWSTCAAPAIGDPLGPGPG
jgi:hypothetical protein